ncbi:hypothetical protein LOB72_06520 [Lactobacillus delbrueckii subsp. lactis]|uniref:hypothetical protein n=1 Tax=Lactobacillus delbrueckii TaxID=1584 RepID=UPI001E4B55EE|nr:hypothetical protein [Lactobacillus delbrueckii]MCD5448400.1 hypothetical protein [Lactobacillus delbrueckii subsp. lactis]
MVIAQRLVWKTSAPTPLFPGKGKTGPAFPDSLDTAHAIGESVSLAELEKSLAIYAEAIYELTK